MTTVTESELKEDPWRAFTSGRGSAVRVVDDRTGATLFYLASLENLQQGHIVADGAPDMSEQYYEGLAEAARAVGVHRSTISRALAPDGPVIAQKTEEGSWLIDKASLHAAYPEDL